MKKMRIRKAVGIVLAAVLMAATISVMPQGVSEVQAATRATVKDVNLNVSNSIAGLVIGQGYTNNSTIYYASKNNNTSYPWKIVAAPQGKLTLLSTGLIGNERQYNAAEDHQNWSGSDICKYLNGENPHTSAGLLPTYFTALEQGDAISPYGDKETTNGHSDINIAQKLVLPSVGEVEDDGTWKLTDVDRQAGGSSAWWLRSPGKEGRAAYVKGSNNSGQSFVETDGDNVKGTNGVRPAFNLNLSSVLFTSARGATKSDFAAVGNEKVKASANTWKLTLLKDGDTSFVTEALPTTGYIGEEITVKVTTAATGTYNQTSAMLTDTTSGTVVAYGKIGDAGTGPRNFTIPDTMAAGDYTLRVFAEQVNSGDLTDYASNVKEVSFKINPSITITPARHMTTKQSGDETQMGLTGAMTEVIYTADTGYYFPDNYASTVTGLPDGISVNRDSDTQITVSGTPTDNGTIVLKEPTKEVTTPPTPTPPPTPPVYLSDIQIETPPARTSYIEGETFDKTGMKVKAIYSDGSGADVTAVCTVSPTGPLTLGDKEVTVSYNSYVKTIPITVLPEEPEEVTIKTAPTKIEYTTGETFDPTGLVLKFRVGEKIVELPYTEAAGELFTFSPTLDEPLKAEQKEVTITYKGKTVSQAITVSQDYADAITLSQTKADLPLGKELTLTATLTPENIRNKEVKWSCSNDKVAQVSNTGTITAVAPGTAVITATAAAKDEASAKTATCTVTVKPGTPKVKAVSQNYNTVKISWDKVTGAQGYELYRRTSSKEDFTKIETLEKTSYSNTKLTTGRTYAYKVRAYTTVGGEKHYGSHSKAVEAMPKPNTPDFDLTAGKGQITVKWKNIKGADGYILYRASSKNGEYKKIKVIRDKGGKYTNTKLTGGKTYYYKMKSYTQVKGKNTYSSTSEAVGKKVR